MRNNEHPFYAKHSDALTDFALVEIIREQIARKKERKKRGDNGWIDHSFSDPRGDALYQILAPLLERDWFWNDVCASVISDMVKHCFWDYPSVNLINTDETKMINIDSRSVKSKNYNVFAKVDLFEHTFNVVQSCSNFFSESNRSTSHIKKLIAAASLLHDIGKHYPLMRNIGIIDAQMPDHCSKHHVLSTNYIYHKMRSVFSVDYKPREFEVDEVVLMVYEHHGSNDITGYKGRGSADLREIDKSARMLEYFEITTGKREQLR